jgi:hypothetical protein
MRWLFLLLLVLNGCYLVWNLQDAPVRAKDISASAQASKGRQDIQLLSEAGNAPNESGKADCDFLGGYSDRTRLLPLAEKLRARDVPIQAFVMADTNGQNAHWLRVAGGALEGSGGLVEVFRDINGLKHKINRCEGIATPEQFE